MKVRLAYRVFDAEGVPVEENPSEFEYIHGFSVMLPQLEDAVAGLAVGGRREVNLAAESAFGPRRKEAIVEFDRLEFPEDVAPGDRFEAENADGALVVLRVLEVGSEAVTVDTNHPLAGQRVRFELTVVAVEPASDEEIAAAEASLQDPIPPEANQLIPLDRLLKGPSRRYELGPAAPGQDGPDDEP